MTNMTANDSRVERYLDGLESALSGAPAAEKMDMLNEIRAHILDAVEGGADVARVLSGLGSPRELVERYRMEGMLRQASQTFSPWVLLRTAWRWAFTGVKGVVAFMVALVGYMSAFVMGVAVMLRPFNHNIGLWVGPRSFDIGTQSDPLAREVLGGAFIPVIAAAAFLIAVATTQWLQRIMRSSGGAQH